MAKKRKLKARILITFYRSKKKKNATRTNLQKTDDTQEHKSESEINAG